MKPEEVMNALHNHNITTMNKLDKLLDRNHKLEEYKKRVLEALHASILGIFFTNNTENDMIELEKYFRKELNLDEEVKP